MKGFVRFSLSVSFVASVANAGDVLDLSDLSLEQLADIKVTTVSKMEESLLETPLSTFVLTRDEMMAAGVNSIPEAFRLVPGFIVREVTNGNFIVVPRGMDGLPTGNTKNRAVVAHYLVMVDNRVVYNYYSGTTFWENLPLGIEDIQQIEIVRGPSSALYGPNALGAVINIITRRPSINGYSSYGRFSGGSHGVVKGNASVSYKDGDRWSLSANVNSDYRRQFSLNYYDVIRQIYVTDPSELSKSLDPNTKQPVSPSVANVSEIWADPGLALKQLGANLLINYNLSEHTKFRMDFGYQDSLAQTIFSSPHNTALSFRKSATGYVDLRANIKGFDGHFSLVKGTMDFPGIKNFNIKQTPPADCTLIGPLGGSVLYRCPNGTNPVSFYDTSSVSYSDESPVDLVDLDMSYEIQLENLRIRPSIQGRYGHFDSSFIQGSQSLANYAGSIQSEYRLSDWRFIGALREDWISNGTNNVSYELAVTKKLGGNHLLRTSLAHSVKSPSLGELHADLTFVSADAVRASGPDHILIATTPVSFSAIHQLPMAAADSFEVGHRWSLASDLVFDNEVFIYRTYDNSGITFESSTKAVVKPIMNASEIGFTSRAYTGRPDLLWRFYWTVQETDTYDLQWNKIGKNAQTPMLFGGMVFNYRPFSNLNININPYFFTATETRFYNYRPVEVGGKILVNARVTYQISGQLSIFGSASGLGSDVNEFGYAGSLGTLYIAGLNAQI